MEKEMEGLKFRYVSVKKCKQIGAGSHGRVYKLNDEQIIKVYTDGSSLEDIEKERFQGKMFFLNGIQSAITFDTVITEYGFGIVFELAGSKTLGKYVSEHPDQFEECAEKFADLLYNMHHLEADTAAIPAIKEKYRADFQAIKAKYFHAEDVKTLIRILDAIPDGNGYIHGDYHPQNAMINEKGELLLIDMADISYGNGLFDVGGSYLSMVFAAKVMKKKLIDFVGLQPEASQRFWRIFLSKYFKTENTAKLNEYERACRYFGYLRLARNIGNLKSGSGISRFVTAIVVKWKLLSHEKECIELFSAFR